MDATPICERVLQGWAQYLSVTLGTTIERNRKAPADLANNEFLILMVDGDEEEFPEDDAFNIVAMAARFHIQVYLRCDLEFIGPQLSAWNGRITKAVLQNRGLQLSETDPELCQPAQTKKLAFERDIWREKGTKPGGSGELTFQCVYTHAWDDPFQLA